MDWKKIIRELGRDYFTSAAGPYMRGTVIVSAGVLGLLALFIVPTELLILAGIVFLIIHLMTKA